METYFLLAISKFYKNFTFIYINEKISFIFSNNLVMLIFFNVLRLRIFFMQNKQSLNPYRSQILYFYKKTDIISNFMKWWTKVLLQPRTVLILIDVVLIMPERLFIKVPLCKKILFASLCSSNTLVSKLS